MNHTIKGTPADSAPTKRRDHITRAIISDASARMTLSRTERDRIKAALDSHYRRIALMLVAGALAFLAFGLWLRFSTD